MSVLTAVERGRRAAANLMLDTAVVTRPGGSPTFNAITGVLVPSVGTVVHTGPCRLRQPTPQESEVLFGEQQVSIARFIAVFPHDVTGIDIDDVITLTTSADPDVIGFEYRVTAVPRSTFTIHKSYACEAVT